MRWFIWVIVLAFSAAALEALYGCAQAPVGQPPASSPSASPAPAQVESQSSIPGFQSAWSSAALSSIKAQLANLNKAGADMNRFCPHYASMNIDQQALAWGYLLSGIVKPESGYNPKSRYREKNGQWSEGLLQLSYGDSCIKSPADGDILDPIVNLKRGVKIMGSLVATAGRVTSGNYDVGRTGLAKYWSTIMTPDSHDHHHLDEIIAMAKKAPGCSN